MDQQQHNVSVNEQHPLPVYTQPTPTFTASAPSALPTFNEPLPTFNEPVPTFKAPQKPKAPPIPAEVIEKTNATFAKSLAAAIMAFFPIASIVAIFFGVSARRKHAELVLLAKQHEARLSGKATAAKILGLVGLFGGIAMTVYYTLAAIWSFFAFVISAITTVNTFFRYLEIFSEFTYYFS